jgi:hypothetical protein
MGFLPKRPNNSAVVHSDGVSSYILLHRLTQAHPILFLNASMETPAARACHRRSQPGFLTPSEKCDICRG